jgi:hypothetical protein
VNRGQKAANPPRARALAGNLALLVASVLLGVTLLEVASRILFPISPGSRTLTLNGDPNPLFFRSNPLRLPANEVYRLVSDEYDSIVTTTKLGFRGPAPAHDPDVIFLGDSFTFGRGLGDEETFAFLYCHQRQLSCANLGRGGTGTKRQLDILEEFLSKENWRPTKVKLFLMVMTSALMAGNDLADNLNEAAEDAEPAVEPGGAAQRILDYRRTLLAHSNLARVVYFLGGPQGGNAN